MSLQVTLPSPVLVFDGTDPTGAAGVQGAVLTLAALGCLPLSVITAIGCGDTRSLDHSYPLDSDWVVEQARAVLEDIRVAAFLVGDIGCLETLAVIAEMAADYDAPLVFVPGDRREAADPDESEDLIAASIELLLPLTTVLVVDASSAANMVANVDDHPDSLPPHDAARVLLQCGAGYVLLADGRDALPQAVDTLIGPTGIVRTDVRPAPVGRIAGALPTLAAALIAGLAHGLEVPQALQQAQAYLASALRHAVMPGMGAGQPDRMAALRHPSS